ncbi:glycosyltransferase family 9 protein [Bradyrhizobium sp. CCBAU 51753]|uniref:glycosyltransferase family 9 protein n=1 Tax=Bradyrhizobium sp. CCBAU 51753 TaxID=1325100 RepID=UPI00188C2127|nr:glycosyltransferase family 9 protein [Bradyrhizobium sp. CCBAU 51753]
MGFGDELLGSGMARGARARGKRIAFGDGRRIIWSTESHQIYQGNENVAPPADSQFRDLIWIPHYKGVRLYGTPRSGGWTWNLDFRSIPGEIFLTDQEKALAAAKMPAGAVLIEPHVKAMAPNKRWPWDRFQEVATRLLRSGHRVVQFSYGQQLLAGVTPIASPSFRASLAMMARCALYIGPEGGLHHGAAAVGTTAVVIFGGYIHPMTTGYATHVNLFGADEACGNTGACEHCRRAMARISADEVFGAAARLLTGGVHDHNPQDLASSDGARAGVRCAG